MTTANNTRTAILDAAQDLVQRQSISGVRFQELAKRIGIKKGSMYYHFESKDDLSIAILERSDNDLKASFKKGESKSAGQQLNYFFSLYNKFMSPGEKLCVGGAFVGEWGTLSDPVQIQANKLINTQIKNIKRIIKLGIDNGDFNQHGKSADDLALWVVSCIQGSLLTCRVSGNKKPFKAAVDVINQYLTHN